MTIDRYAMNAQVERVVTRKIYAVHAKNCQLISTPGTPAWTNEEKEILKETPEQFNQVEESDVEIRHILVSDSQLFCLPNLRGRLMRIRR
jgi:hypothetical protein